MNIDAEQTQPETITDADLLIISGIGDLSSRFGWAWKIVQPIETAKREAVRLLQWRDKIAIKNMTPAEKQAKEVSDTDAALRDLHSSLVTMMAPPGFDRALVAMGVETASNNPLTPQEIASVMGRFDPWQDNVKLPSSLEEWRLALGLPGGAGKSAILDKIRERNDAMVARRKRAELRDLQQVLRVDAVRLSAAKVRIQAPGMEQREMVSLFSTIAEIERSRSEAVIPDAKRFGMAAPLLVTFSADGVCVK